MPLPKIIAILDDNITLSSDPRALHRYAFLRTIPTVGGYTLQTLTVAEEQRLEKDEDTQQCGTHKIRMYQTREERSQVQQMIWKTGWKFILDGEEVPVIDFEFRFVCDECQFSVKAVGDSLGAFRERQRTQQSLRCERFGKRLKYVPAPVPLHIPAFIGDLIKADLVRQGARCPISLTDFAADVPAAITSCFHTFDPEALDAWFTKKMNCPTCRAPVTNTMIV